MRRSRRRFWKSANDEDKLDAEETLYHVLVTLSKLLAPFTPFVAEEIYRNLTGGGLYADERGRESVHLEDWPVLPMAKTSPKSKKMTQEMQLARTITSLALRARQEGGVRVRQPLARLSVALTAKLSKTTEELVMDEINVKQLSYVKRAEDLGKRQVKLNFAVAGKKYGAEVKKIQKDLASGLLKKKLDPEDTVVTYQGKPGTAVAGEKGVLVALDLKLTPALEDEGLVREVVRAVQDLRKEAKYAVTDRIKLIISTEDEPFLRALKDFSEYLKAETLAMSINHERGPADVSAQFSLGDFKAWLGVKKTNV